MRFCIRVPIVFSLLLAWCHTSAQAQINSGWFPHHAPLPYIEPCFDPGPIVGCYRDVPPCWLGQTSFDVLLLDRSNADSRTIVTNTGTGNELLNTTDLGYPVHAAFRVNFVLPGCNGCDLVVNYLGARFENSRVHDATTASYDFFEFPSLTPASATSFETSYVSTLNSVELNTRVRQWERFAPLSGLRYIGLCDEFDRLSGTDSSEIATSSTSNQMFGFQVGGEALLLDAGSVRLQSVGKLGAFYNNVTLTTGGEDITTAMFDPTTTFGAQHVSFFGEANLEFSFQVDPRWAIRVGYTVMALDGAALAPDQHNDFNLQSGIGTFDYGTIVYHGSYIGIEGTW
ncbi:MAG: hypothetical protein H6822_22660 [Planctomycetaceae bacterium]|nr:hypothetical protein [Planctomycetales bacterium]MCB9924997.1 hypothetical protein [Planctomycetaceae bacterium]